MINVKDRETAIRIVESFNALSVVLPIYDEEARRAFRATFDVDIADLLPEFFRSISRLSISNQSDFELYLNYFAELVKYVKMERDNIPIPNNGNDGYFIQCRDIAEKLLNAWAVKEK